MKKHIEKSNEPFDAKQLEALENIMSISMPTDIREFLEKYNGGIPEMNMLKGVEKDCSVGVNKFLSIQEIISKKHEMTDRLMEMVIPIAEAEGGNYVCLSFEKEKEGVYFWDHELETDEDVPPLWDNMFYLTSTFTEFINGLEKLDLNDVELKPEDVKSVWINSDFLEEMKRKGYMQE